MSRSKSRGQLSLFSVVVALAIIGCRQWQGGQTTKNPRPRATSKTNGNTGTTRPGVANSNDGHLLLGNPSNAGRDENNYFLQKPQFVMSYNRSKGTPNWVAWHTDASDLGRTKRRDNFHADEDLPAAWRISPSDYLRSGYDRGHVCPSGDRTSSPEDNEATFNMSNMMPQTGDLNRNIWADFEDYLRDQIKAGNEVYEVAGPTKEAARIADGKVAVPSACWKVALILPLGTGDLKRIDANTRLICVGMPNVTDERIAKGDWRKYITSLTKIESATKLNFLSALPGNVKNALSEKIDSGA